MRKLFFLILSLLLSGSCNPAFADVPSLPTKLTLNNSDRVVWIDANNNYFGITFATLSSIISGGSGMIWPLTGGIAVYNGASGWGTSLTAPTGTIVGTTDSQVLTNKDLTDVSNIFPTFNQNTTGNAATVTTINGKITAGTNITVTGSGTSGSPYAISATGGSGTVTSVTFTGDGIIDSSSASSAVTTSGTVTATVIQQAKNTVLAGPTTGSNANPSFRALIGADLPNPAASTLGGIESYASVSHQWINAISTSGVPSSTQPAFTDISGSVAASQLPNPSASTLGGIESYGSVSHQWINAISTSGVPSSTQPSYTDLSGIQTMASSALVGITDTQTLSNKRNKYRVVTVTASATPTWNTDNGDIFEMSSMSAAVTSMTTNLTGTANDGDIAEFIFTDNGTARGITWGASFESTTVTLPTTTVISTPLKVFLQWNTTASKWDCIGTA